MGVVSACEELAPVLELVLVQVEELGLGLELGMAVSLLPLGVLGSPSVP